MKKWLKSGIALGLSLVLLTGCSLGGKDSKTPSAPTSLKVMYYDEGSFYQEYGMLFSTLYPEVDIQVVTTNSIYNNRNGNEEEFDYEAEYEKFLDQEKPDIIMTDINQIKKFAEEGKLYDIESFVNGSSFDKEGLVPGLIDYMKSLGNGKLYGLPTSFNSQVLYYNKDLFDRFNISYPTDQMTWEEVLQIAQMFPTDGENLDRIFGLRMTWSPGLNELVSTLGTAAGLQMYNTDTLQMTIDTPAWQSIVEQAQSAMNSKALFYDSLMWEQSENGSFFRDGDHYSRDPFLSGRLAMKIEGNYLINEIEQAKNYAQDPDSIISNWDMVTVPVNPQSPDESYMSNYYNIFAISNNSTNVDAAWKFISYISSDEYARVKSKLNYGNLPMRMKYLAKDTEHNYEAFYKLKPAINTQDAADWTKIPQRFQYEFYELMNTELTKVQDGKLSVKEALSTLQLKGNELLASAPMTEEEMQTYWEQRGNGAVDFPTIELPTISEDVVEETVAE